MNMNEKDITSDTGFKLGVSASQNDSRKPDVLSQTASLKSVPIFLK